MIKRQLMAGLLLLLITPASLFAVNVHVGIRGEGAITRGYGNIGLYTFNGVFAGVTPEVVAVRSTNQMVQFSGALGVFTQVDITDWYSLVPEVMFAFNRGLTYAGNYMKSSIVDGPDHPELTGEMRYSWMAFNFNLINQFTVVRPTEMVSVHLLGGLSTSVILGRVKEQFNPDFAGVADATQGNINMPYNEANTRFFTPDKRFDVGIMAGFGAQVDFGNAGRLSVDFRSTWYFLPQIKTYLSPDNGVRMSLPFSLTLGYSVKVM
ncbi:hypothetical protein [Entomospira culicis]|uniref:Outer membrane protein beta-barrel domain-containing protein n=1 Tax=Entomospira culicis TaxID=2719989 RepID=A0A968GFF2_9SPIO|nr:hypothetical protein [Entomospira culicis]NIZ18621.1 hypothetical protein [Entomospira culicis]NIZ68836.1 hypothetical protein [Entomospira culicis]WDI37430.1 hypothetical protein PVA46_01180 [Entomospira culicis]WDI39058.1 hypothetical protein PVA47_01185 [Entomospira culicis]